MRKLLIGCGTVEHGDTAHYEVDSRPHDKRRGGYDDQVHTISDTMQPISDALLDRLATAISDAIQRYKCKASTYLKLKLPDQQAILDQLTALDLQVTTAAIDERLQQTDPFTLTDLIRLTPAPRQFYRWAVYGVVTEKSASDSTAADRELPGSYIGSATCQAADGSRRGGFATRLSCYENWRTASAIPGRVRKDAHRGLTPKAVPLISIDYPQGDIHTKRLFMLLIETAISDISGSYRRS